MHQDAAPMHITKRPHIESLDYERRAPNFIGGRRYYPAARRMTGLASEAFNGWQFSLVVFMSLAGCQATQCVFWTRPFA